MKSDLAKYCKKFSRILLITPLLIALSAFSKAAENNIETLTFGIVPQQSASQLVSVWNPVLLQLSKQTGINIVFRTAPDIPIFEQRLATGAYDIAYMNPYHYISYHRLTGYEAVAKAKNKKLKGIMVARNDSNIDNLAQLSGQTLAFPSPAAFAASVLPRAELTKKKIDFKAKYVLSHDSVYMSIAKGLYPAGGGVIRTFNSLSPRLKKQLKIIWTSNGYTPHAIAVHPRVSEKNINLIKAALLSLAESAEGQVNLGKLKIKAFEAAQNSDWNDIMELEIATPLGSF